MKDWWDGLEGRERVILAIGAAVLVIAVLWVALIHPLFIAGGQRAERVQQLRGDLARARSLGAEIQALTASGGGSTAVTGREQSLMIVLERTARDSGLQVNQSRPMDAETVRVRFESAPFDILVQWIGQLATRYGVQADIVSIDQLDSPGMVDAQITLKRPSA